MKTKTTIYALLVALATAGTGYLIWADQPASPVTSTIERADTVVLRLKGGLLEVSEVRATETFQATTVERLLGVRVGTTTTTVRVPAVYRYRVELAPQWTVLLRGKTAIAIAPVEKPALPVAIDTGKLEAGATGFWSPFTGATRTEELERSISRSLEIKAKSPGQIQLQREAARRTLEEFVRTWLLAQERGNAQSQYTVRVLFADESVQSLNALATVSP